MTDRLDAALADLAGAVEFPPRPDLRAADRRSPAGVSRGGVGDCQGLGLVRWSSRSSRLLGPGCGAAALVLRVPGPAPDIRPQSPTTSVPRTARSGHGWRSATAVAPSTRSRPPPGALGPPDEAYVIDGGAVASLVYAAGDGLPEIGERRSGC